MDIVLKEYEVGEGKCSFVPAGAEHSASLWTYRFKGYKRKDECTNPYYPHLIVMNSEGEGGSIFFVFKDPKRKTDPGKFYSDVVYSTSFGKQDREFTEVVKKFYPSIRELPSSVPKSFCFQDSSSTTTEYDTTPVEATTEYYSTEVDSYEMWDD
eukprot:GHVP01017931.1.p1 GENE.GHVP01017931.1~~GHVP01017931.1.p1  ORF type:complete len:169 (-),score=18.52 GHVP01017931.1:54-515(-)